jgi:hypothetical protein
VKAPAGPNDHMAGIVDHDIQSFVFTDNLLNRRVETEATSIRANSQTGVCSAQW